MTHFTKVLERILEEDNQELVLVKLSDKEKLFDAMSKFISPEDVQYLLYLEEKRIGNEFIFFPYDCTWARIDPETILDLKITRL
jgi:hypothetical protein